MGVFPLLVFGRGWTEKWVDRRRAAREALVACAMAGKPAETRSGSEGREDPSSKLRLKGMQISGEGGGMLAAQIMSCNSTGRFRKLVKDGIFGFWFLCVLLYDGAVWSEYFGLKNFWRARLD